MANRNTLKAAHKLQAWLTLHEITRAEFAEVIGVDRSTVYRYLDGTMRPAWSQVRAITEKTGGAVDANDWVEG